MTPSQIFQRLLNTNKAAANFILGGLALLAAAAIAISWIGNNPDALFLSAYILGFAFLVTMAVWIVRNPQTRAVIGWMLTGLIVIFLLGLVESAISLTGRLPTPACYIRILWEHPRSCELRLFPAVPIAHANPPRITLATSGGPERLWLAQDTTTGPATGLRETPYLTGPIYLQFGANVDRPAAIGLATALAAQGWPISGGDAGGELMTSLPDNNEIRFFDSASEADALALARTLKAARPGTDVYVRDFSRSGLIAPLGQLEIWLSE